MHERDAVGPRQFGELVNVSVVHEHAVPGRCSVFPMTARPLQSRPIRVGLVRCLAGADRLPASKTKWQIDLRTLHLFGGEITDRGLFDYSACCCSVRRTR